jgi:hypothetical protein
MEPLINIVAERQAREALERQQCRQAFRESLRDAADWFLRQKTLRQWSWNDPIGILELPEPLRNTLVATWILSNDSEYESFCDLDDANNLVRLLCQASLNTNNLTEFLNAWREQAAEFWRDTLNDKLQDAVIQAESEHA